MSGMFSLEGKIAVVTGAGSGIGQGIALGLAQAGADIVAVCHTSTGGVEEKVAAMGRRCQIVKADLSAMASVDQITAAALDAFGRIDILVNAAGQIYREPALTHPEDKWDLVMDVNLKMPYFLSQRVAQHMVEKGIHGRIINIASMNSAAFSSPAILPPSTPSWALRRRCPTSGPSTASVSTLWRPDGSIRS